MAQEEDDKEIQEAIKKAEDFYKKIKKKKNK